MDGIRLLTASAVATLSLALAPAALADEIPEISTPSVSSSQEGDSAADVTQNSDASSGDALAGQVTGVVGPADTTSLAPAGGEETADREPARGDRADGDIDPETQELIDSIQRALDSLDPGYDDLLQDLTPVIGPLA